MRRLLKFPRNLLTKVGITSSDVGRVSVTLPWPTFVCVGYDYEPEELVGGLGFPQGPCNQIGFR